MKNRMQWEEVGTVGVDAGIVMIGDPCYTLPDDATHRDKVAKKWDKFCDVITDKDVSEPFGAGIALVISSGYGDGKYPVYVKRNSEGRIMQMMVNFGE